MIVLGSSALYREVTSMSDPVPSKVWSTSTLLNGVNHVSTDANVAELEAEEFRLEMELQDASAVQL